MEIESQEMRAKAWEPLHAQAERYARRSFRCLKDRAEAEDRVSDAIAYMWYRWDRARRRGVDQAAEWNKHMARAVRYVKSGRRFTSRERAGEVLSWKTQRDHGVSVSALQPFDIASDRANPLDQAIANLDVRDWIGRQRAVEAQVCGLYLLGYRSPSVGSALGLNGPAALRIRHAVRDRFFAEHPDW